MSFLLLAQGDPIGKDLLKKLVIARYGFSPPAMETLRIRYRGRSRSKLGPFPVWVSLDATATYCFPLMMKWEMKVSVLRLFRSSYTTSFDGQAVYEQQGIHVTRSTDADMVESARRRAWSEAVFFVSPLIADRDVRVEGVDARSFRARLSGYDNDFAIVRLEDDHTLKEIEVERADPWGGERKTQYIRTRGSLIKVDGLLLPPLVQRYWGDKMFMELEPVAVEINPALTPDDFVLREDEDTPAGEEEATTAEEAEASE